MLENKNILLVSPEPWDHIFVSKHHYAIHLAKRKNKVFFLGPPSGKHFVSETEYENVYSVEYTGFLKGLRFYPGFVQRYFIWRKFKAIQNLCKVKFDIVWSFDNSVFFDFSALSSNVLRICHIVDLNQDFQTKVSAGTADFCFCTTDLIKERLLRYNRNTFKINHGYNLEGQRDTTMQLPGSGTTKAVYAGNLSMPYIDWKSLHDAVILNSKTDFIFIGPDKEATSLSAEGEFKAQLKGKSNVYFLGRVEANLLQAFYRSADVLLVSYLEKFHPEQANPHKLIEYLGSGKVVVTTYTSEYRQYADLMVMTDENEEFPQAVKKVISDLYFFNSESLAERRMTFALDNTYDKQIERIEKILKHPHDNTFLK